MTNDDLSQDDLDNPHIWIPPAMNHLLTILARPNFDDANKAAAWDQINLIRRCLAGGITDE